MSDESTAPKLKWSMSPSIGKLVEALAKAQLKYDPALKDTKNPAYNSKYADLASIIGATQPHLAAEGIVVIQMPQSDFGPEDAKMLTLTTLVAHSSGEWISSDLQLPAIMRERFDAQSTGSAITYAKRYGYSAMTGVAPEVDDDGNRASGVGSKDAQQAIVDKYKRKAGQEGVSIMEWKENQLAITGNGLSIIRATLTEAEKTQLNVKYDKEGKVYVIQAADGNFFASLAERQGVPVVWEAKN